MDHFPIDPLTATPTPAPDVMIMAAGLGTRMRPLTFERPKALIEVAGKPLIDYGIDAALSEGCTRFVVNAHHKAEQLRAHIARLAGSMPDIGFEISDESKRLLDTGGGLRQALPLLTTDPLLVLNCDSFWLPGGDTPISRLRSAYEKGGADIVLLCVDPQKAFGLHKGADFLLTADGEISRTVGRPVVYAGAALVSRAVAANGPDVPFSLARSFLAARDAGRLRGLMIETAWFHVGDPGAIARTEQEIGALV